MKVHGTQPSNHVSVLVSTLRFATAHQVDSFTDGFRCKAFEGIAHLLVRMILLFLMRVLTGRD